MAQNQQIRKRMTEIQAEAPADKEWWEKKRANISSEFMKELDKEASTASKGPKGSDDEAVLVESGGPAVSQQGGGKKKKKGKN
jgi:translocation protein SEC66